MTILTERLCPQCGRPVIVTRRNPNRRFCTPRCRAAHHRSHRSHPARPANDVMNDVPVPNDLTAPNDVTNVVPAAPNVVPAAPNVVPAANGIQRCPHCRAELAVIAVVVPATAAHVRTPEVIHMSPT
jgi:ribosomal protein L37AE/L43A